MTTLSAGQRQALDDLALIAARTPLVLFDRVDGAFDDRGWYDVLVWMRFPNASPASGVIDPAKPEPMIISIPPEFPFRRPRLAVPHLRFADFPHVDWGRHICLYQGSREWDAAAGMAGFVARIDEWYMRAAAEKLDLPEQPIHPPANAPTDEGGCVIMRTALPPAARRGAAWVGVGVLHAQAGDRTDRPGRRETDRQRWDVVGWSDQVPEVVRLDQLVAAGLITEPQRYAAVIVLGRPMSFEYPNTIGALFDSLIDRGVDGDRVLEIMVSASRANDHLTGSARGSLYVLIGSPTRRFAPDGDQLLQFAAWRIDPSAHDPEHILDARPSWARVYDQRPSNTTRRDVGRPAEWLRDKKIVIMGCGALGAPIAEHCVRAGAASVELFDNGRVNPGILVRQPYEERDIGEPKASALARRLRRIAPRAKLIGRPSDVLYTLLGERAAIPQADLVVDATADETVRCKLERRRWQDSSAWPPVLSVTIGHDAERGLATLALPEATGATRDILRKVAIASYLDSDLADVADDIFPLTRRTDLLHPEWGCSDPTFAGSAADLASLAADLLNAGLAELAHGDGTSSTAHVVRAGAAAGRRLAWPDDVVARDGDRLDGYEVRFTPAAMESMRRACADVPDGHESGGLLLGLVDDACRVAWVTAATGPPPDSTTDPGFFRCGTKGAADLIGRYQSASGRQVRFIGYWHSHPGGIARHSADDASAMTELSRATDTHPPRAVYAVLGGGQETTAAGPDRSTSPDLAVVVRNATVATSDAAG